MPIGPLILLFPHTAVRALSHRDRNEMPAVVTFVAPAYPRVAKDQRKMGRTVTRIDARSAGSVAEVKLKLICPTRITLILLPRRQGECLVIRPTRRANHEQRRRKNRQESRARI
jgi:hypothetical protein